MNPIYRKPLRAGRADRGPFFASALAPNARAVRLSPAALVFGRLMFCGLLLALVSFGAQATTYTVTSNADSGGTCPDAANCTLRDAITAATSGSDIIVFNGDMTITLASTLTLTNSVTVDATGNNVTVDGNHAVTVFQVNASATAQITHLTIQNGSSNAGSGIYNQGTLTLTDSTLSNNSATGAPGSPGPNNYNANGGKGGAGGPGGTGQGGGIYNSGALTLIGSTLSGNSAQGGNGGNGGNGADGTFNGFDRGRGGDGGAGGAGGSGQGGGISNSGTLTLVDSTLSSNNIDGGTGGSGGSGGFGGSMFVPSNGFCGDGGPGGSSVGGGISNSGTLTLVNSTPASNNVSGGDGGSNDFLVGFSCRGGDGGSGAGGGIYNSSMSMLTNDTLSGNTVSGGAGGFGGYGSGAPGTSDGAGLDTSGGTVTFTNTIVAGGCAGTQTDGGGNIDTGSSCGFGGGSQSNVANLNLGALADNGGPTQTMLPGAGSAAINAIVCTNAPLTDQLDYLRPDPSSVGLATPCDVGAVEAGSVLSDSIFADGFGPPPIYK